MPSPNHAPHSLGGVAPSSGPATDVHGRHFPDHMIDSEMCYLFLSLHYLTLFHHALTSRGGWAGGYRRTTMFGRWRMASAPPSTKCSAVAQMRATVVTRPLLHNLKVPRGCGPPPKPLVNHLKASQAQEPLRRSGSRKPIAASPLRLHRCDPTMSIRCRCQASSTRP